jgi:hypothetical protein
MYPTPVEAKDFQWRDLEASGLTSMGEAYKELEQQLSHRRGFMQEATGSFAPVIILMSDGEPTDDAAYIELGREYHVPSYDQVYELMRNTKSKHFMADNGVNCIELKSIRNDKSIIFPMSGFYSKTDAINPKKLCSKNFETLIWVSCLSNGVDLHATALNIDFHKNEQFITFKNRCNGFQIRPVTMTK